MGPPVSNNTCEDLYNGLCFCMKFVHGVSKFEHGVLKFEMGVLRIILSGMIFYITTTT